MDWFGFNASKGEGEMDEAARQATEAAIRKVLLDTPAGPDRDSELKKYPPETVHRIQTELQQEDDVKPAATDNTNDDNNNLDASASSNNDAERRESVFADNIFFMGSVAAKFMGAANTNRSANSMKLEGAIRNYLKEHGEERLRASGNWRKEDIDEVMEKIKKEEELLELAEREAANSAPTSRRPSASYEEEEESSAPDISAAPTTSTFKTVESAESGTESAVTTPKRVNTLEVAASPSGEAVEMIQAFESQDTNDDTIEASRTSQSEEGGESNTNEEDSPLRADTQEHPAKTDAPPPPPDETNKDEIEPTPPPEIARTSTEGASTSLDGSSIPLDVSSSADQGATPPSSNLHLPASASDEIITPPSGLSANESDITPAPSLDEAAATQQATQQNASADDTGALQSQIDSLESTVLALQEQLAAVHNPHQEQRRASHGHASLHLEPTDELAVSLLGISNRSGNASSRPSIAFDEATSRTFEVLFQEATEELKALRAQTLELMDEKEALLQQSTGTFEQTAMLEKERDEAVQAKESADQQISALQEELAQSREQQQLQSTDDQQTTVLQKERDELDQQIASLQEELAESRVQQQTLAAEKESWNAEREELETKLDQTVEQLVDATMQVTELKEEQAEAEEERERALHAKAKAERSRRASLTMITSLETTLAQKEADMDSSRATVDNVKVSLETKISELEDTVKQQSAQLQEVNEQVDTLEADKAQLMTVSDRVAEQREEETQKLVEMVQALEMLSAEVETLREKEEELQEAQAQMEKLNKVVKTLELDNAKLSMELESANSHEARELQKGQAELDGVTAEYKKIQEDLKWKEGELEDVRRDSLSLGKANAKLLADLESADGENKQQLQKVEDELEALQADNAKLAAELESVKSERGKEELRGHVELQGLKAEYEKILGDLKNKDEELENVRRDSQSLEKANSKLLADVESADAENNEQLQKLQGALQTLQADNAKLSAEVESVVTEKAAELQSVRRESQSLEKVNAKLLADLESADAAENEELKRVQGALETLQEESAKVSAELESVRAERATSGSVLANMESLGKEKETMVNFLKTKLTALGSSHEALQQAKTSLEAELSDLQRSSSESQSKHLEVQEELSLLKTELEQAKSVKEQELQRGQTELEGAKAEYGKLLATLKNKEDELEGVRRESQSLQGINNKLLADLESTDAENDAELKKVQGVLETVEEERNRLSSELERLQEEASTLEKMNTRLLNDLESADADNGKAMEQLEAAYESSKTENSRLVADLETTISKKNEELQMVQDQLEGLKGDEALLRAENAKLQGELEALGVTKEEELKKAQTSFEALQADNERVLEVNGRLLKATESMEEELKNSKGEVEELSRKKSDIMATVESMEEEKKVLSESIESLELSLKQSEATVVTLKETMASIEQSSGTNGEELQRLLKEKENLSSRALEQEALAEKNGRELAKVSEELASAAMDKESLMEDIESLRRKLHEANSSQETLEASLKESGNTNEKLRDTISMLETAGEDMLKAVEEEKQMLLEQLEAKAVSEMERVNEQVVSITAEKNSLSKTLEGVHQELRETMTSNNTLETSLRESNATMDNLRETIILLENAGEDMVKAFEEEKQSNNALETSLRESNATVESLRETITLLENAGEEMVKAFEDEKQSKNALETSVHESNVTVESLRETITSLETAGEEMLKAVEEEKQTLEGKCREQVDAVKSEKKALEAAMKIIREEMQEAGMARGKAEAQLRESEATVEQLRETIDMLESAGEDMLKAVGEEKESLVDQVATLESKLKESESVRSEHNKKLDLLAAEKDTSVSELEKTREALEENCASLEVSRSTIQKLQAAVTTLKAETESGQRAIIEERKVANIEPRGLESNTKPSEQLIEVTSAKESMENELRSTQQRASELEATVERMKNEIEQMSTKLDRVSEEKTRVQAQLKDGKELIRKATSQLTVANEKIGTQAELVESLMEEKNTLVSNLMKGSEEYQAAISAREGLESELEEARSELKVLRDAIEDAKNQQANAALKEVKDTSSTRSLPVAGKESRTAVSEDGGDVDATEATESLQEKIRVLEESLQQTEEQLEQAETRPSLVENQELEAKLQKASTERESLQTEVEELTAKTKELEKLVNECGSGRTPKMLLEANEVLMTKAEFLEEVNEELETKLQEASTERESLQAEVEELTARSKELEKLVYESGSGSQSPPKMLLEANEALMQKVSFIEEALKESRRKTETAEERLNSLVQESYQLEAEAENARYEQRALVIKNEELESKLVEVESAATNLRGQVEVLMAGTSTEIEVAMKESAPAALAGANAALEEQVLRLEGELKGSEEKRRQLEEELGALAKSGGYTNEGEETLAEKQLLLSKLSDAEAEADELREQVEELLSRSQEMDSIADEEDAVLREQVDTLTSWNLALEAIAEKSNKELEEARVELEELRTSMQAPHQFHSDPQVTSRSIPAGNVPDNSLIDAPQEEKRSLTVKVDRLDEALAERDCKVAELEARLEEHVDKSAELKMRLARKSAMLSELEQELEEQAPGKPSHIRDKESMDSEDGLLRQQLDAVNAFNLALEGNMDRSKKELEEARTEIEALRTRLSPEEKPGTNPQDQQKSIPDSSLVETLQNEKRTLTAKIDQQDEKLAEEKCKVAELEARLEEYVGKSAELKMRLARKSAMLSELEEELEGQTSGQPSQSRELQNIADESRCLQSLDKSMAASESQDQSSSMGGLQKETQALVAKVEQLEETLAEKEGRVSHLEGRLANEMEVRLANELRVRQANSQIAIVDGLQKEKLALTAEVEQLEQALTEKGNEVSELQARLPNEPNSASNTPVKKKKGKIFSRMLFGGKKYPNESETPEGTPVARPSPSGGGAREEEGLQSTSSDKDSTDPEIEKQTLTAKVNQLEEALAERDSMVADLEARLKQHIDDKSAGLQMHLAEKTALPQPEEEPVGASSKAGLTSAANESGGSEPSKSPGSEKDSADQEKQAMAAQINQLDETLAERDCKVAELEARLEEHVDKSADLKMRLARKTALVSELEEELEEKASNNQGQLTGSANESRGSELLQGPGPENESSNQEDEKQATTAQINQLDEALAERDCKVAELEARLEEHVDKSADLKMRLARKTALVSELEEELEEKASNDQGQLTSSANESKGSELLQRPGPENESLNQEAEKQAMTAHLNQLDEALAEKNCKVAELEACLEESLGKSAELKMRLARKTARISELEEELEEQGNTPATSTARSLEGSNRAQGLIGEEQEELRALTDEPTKAEATIEEMTRTAQKLDSKSSLEIQTLTNELSKAEAAIGQQTRKIDQLEESLADKSATIAELEVSLEEQVGKSSDLKLRLARKSSMVADLEDQIAEASSTPGVGSSEIQALADEVSKAEATIKLQTKKMNELGESLAEKSATISELESSLKDMVGESADRKLQLAKKSSLIAEPEDQIAEAEKTAKAGGDGPSTFASAYASSSDREELEKENQLLTVKVARTEASLKREKANFEEQKAKIVQLEDTIADKGVRISELEVTLEEQIGISADMKMRLARRTATIAELQEELDDNSTRGDVQPALDAVSDNRELPMFEETSRALPTYDEEPELMNQYTSSKEPGLPALEQMSRSLPTESKLQEESPIPLKDQTPSEQLHACMEDAKANEALYDQIVSLVDFAEQKKQRLKKMNERLENAMTKSRAITSKTTPTSPSPKPDGEPKSEESGLAQEQAALQKTVQHLESQWKETRTQLENVHKMNLKLEATLDHLSKERESAVAARTVLESSLRAAQEEVRNLRVAVEAMEVERPPASRPPATIERSQSETEISEHPNMDPERTSIPVRLLD